MSNWAKILFTTCLAGLLFVSIPLEHTMAASTDPVTQQVQIILKLINQNHWEQAIEPTNKLKKIFIKNKWKYQLFGDEEEYEGLYREINKLRAAVQEKDSTESKVIISEILTVIEEIFTL